VTTGGRGRAVTKIVVAVLVALSLLPVANWIPSERTAPWYPAVARGWVIGTVIVCLAAGLLAVASFRVPGLWRSGAVAAGLSQFDPATTRGRWLGAGTALVAYLLVSGLVFDGRPLLIDEVVQLFQARTYAAGRLWLPVDPDPAFRSALNLVEHQGRWFGHFPAGWPLVLALGELIRTPWVVGPIVGALTVAAWGAVLARAEPRPSVRAGATLLFAVAPFPLFVAASHMNHGPLLLWVLVGLAGWLRYQEQPNPGLGLAIGAAVGMAGITRPADAAAFLVPALVWAGWWARRTGQVGRLGPLVLGAVVPVSFQLLVNWATTGELLRSGYSLMWGSNVGLGFHEAPYGPPHTPVRGLELLGLNLLRLNRYLFEAPVPGLVAAGASLLLTRTFAAVDRYLLAAAAGLLAIYFSYWHDGFFLGPRFVYPLAPIIAWWTARLPSVVAERFGDGIGRRAAGYGLALSAAGAVAIGIPASIGANSEIQPAMRFDPDRAAAAAGIRHSVILVRESWGAQLLARLWAVGAPRPLAERLYRNIDSCILDQALGRIERGDSVGAIAGLAGLMADSGRLVRSPFSPDTTERVLDGARYPRACMDRINEDRAGFTLLAPTLQSRRDDLLFVRDLHERNRRLLERYPDRSVHLLYHGRGDSVPRFVAVDRDSVIGLGQR
jgi:hypothetical protein